MSSMGSVTHWIGQLKAGDHEAARPLWERYFEQLVRLARNKLRGLPRRAADEEDVALSAFDSFCRGAEQGHFPQLQNSNDLWPLLVRITARKVFDLLRAERRQKRGGGAVMGESAWPNPENASDRQRGIEQVIGPEPTPAFAAQVAEEYQHLLECLDDAELRAVAIWKMESYTNQEIAAKLGCVVRSVERKLHVIRKVWEKEGKP